MCAPRSLGADASISTVAAAVAIQGALFPFFPFSLPTFLPLFVRLLGRRRSCLRVVRLFVGWFVVQGLPKPLVTKPSTFSLPSAGEPLPLWLPLLTSDSTKKRKKLAASSLTGSRDRAGVQSQVKSDGRMKSLKNRRIPASKQKLPQL